jgi:protein-disulfide isomerase
MMRPMRRAPFLGPSLVLLSLLGTGCDDGVDVEGLERKVEVLEQQEREAAKTLADLQTSQREATEAAATARTENAALMARVDDLAAKVSLLEEEISELDNKAQQAAKPTIVAGRPDPADRYRVEVGDSPVLGPVDAKITVVWFSDYQCPFCKRVQSTIEDVRREYGDDVRIVAKHNPLPFHKDALPAAIAAEAAHKQGKFWELQELLYENNRDLTKANFAKWAKTVGCDVAKFKKDLEDRDLEDRIKDDQALAAKVGARGTPAFFINGRFLSGAQPLDAFKRLIDEEIAEADRRLSAGSSRSTLYDDLMRSAKPGV